MTKSYQAIDYQKKYKTNEQIRRVAAHNLRKGKLPKNCDPELTHLNKYLVGSKTMDVVKQLDTMLDGVKYRKDAVRTAHMVFSASPEWFDTSTEETRALWEERTMEYVKDTFGEQNILYATVHYDEKTPHIHICAVPLVDNKLNMKAIFNGKQGLADNFHTKYNEYVKDLGLERGVAFSKANRTEIDEYEKMLKNALELVNASQDKFNETFEKALDSRDNLTKFVDTVKKKLLPAFEIFKNKIREKDKVIKNYEKYEDRVNAILEPLKEVVGGWSGELPELEQIEQFVSDFKALKYGNKFNALNNLGTIRENAKERDIWNIDTKELTNEELKTVLTPRKQLTETKKKKL
jgi:flagellar hook-basal body complex protein FliE